MQGQTLPMRGNGAWGDTTVTSFSEHLSKLVTSQQQGGMDHTSCCVWVYGHRAAGSVLRCPREKDENVCVWKFPLK